MQLRPPTWPCCRHAVAQAFRYGILPGSHGPDEARLTILQVGSGIQIMSVVETIEPRVQPFYNSYRGIGGNLYSMAALQNGGTGIRMGPHRSRRLLAGNVPCGLRGERRQLAASSSCPM
ncbi:hypothetical protein F2981_01645 [Sinorhizobium meliloti]|nr:hypothetical protein [Sinorhizobium meliloti]